MDTILVKDGKNRVTVSVAEKGATGPAGPQGQSANLPPANSTTLGGIIVGDNLTITGNGVLSVANTFQPKLANTTYGLTDTGVPYITGYTNYYVNGDYVTSGLNKYYIGLRGEKVLSNGTYLDPDLYAVGNYKYNGNGTLTSASSLEFGEYSTALITSDSNGFSTLISSAGSVAMVASNATYQSVLSLGSGIISGNAGNGFFRLRGNLGGTGDNSQNYQLAFGPNSGFDRGICFQQVALKSTIGFQYAYSASSISYNMTNGLIFDNSTSLGGFTGTPGTYTSFQHTTDAVISGVRTGTEIRASRNKVELLYLNVSPSYTANSILTQGYADTRYLTSANLTYANITGTPTTLAGYGITDGLTSANLTPYLTTASANSTYAVLGHTHAIANVTGLQAALDAKLPSANFTYANLTGKPTLANVATSGSYTDLSNTPTAYSLPTATTSVLGGIKVGANLSISNGVLSAISSGSSTTSLPWANITSTPTTLAGYGITDGLTASNLTAYLTSATAASTYLPIANFTYANITGKPTLATVATTGSYTDLTNTPASYSLPTATTSVLGGVKVDGSTITISSGVISASSSYSLPVASASVLGGVKLGTGVSVDANGFLTVSTAYAGTGANSFTGTQDLGGNLLTQPKLQAYRETSTAPTISSGTLTLDLSGSNFFAVSLNAAITTLTISNTPASSAASFTLELTADGTARAVTWGAAIKWSGGTAPTLTSTSGKKDVFAFYSNDGGTTWQGFIGGQNF